jgi:hypothetical protein
MNLGGLAVTSTGSALDPFTASVNSATRTWTDADVDFVPECDLTSPVANGECGLISNTNFGRTGVTTHWDPDYLTGWGKRGFNWEGSVSLQQQVRPGMSVDVAYYRRWYGNRTGTDNLLTTSADFDPYCVNVAADPRLPSPGGYSLCGLYEIKPALFGRFDNLVSPVERFGKITEYWHSVDINVDVRAVRGVQLSGGMSIGRGVLDTCDVASKVDNPAGTTVSAMGLSTLARPTRCITIRRFQPSHLQVQRHRASPMWNSPLLEFSKQSGHCGRRERKYPCVPNDAGPQLFGGARHDSALRARDEIRGSGHADRLQIQPAASGERRDSDTQCRYVQRVQRQYHPGREQHVRRELGQADVRPSWTATEVRCTSGVLTARR